MKTGQPSKSGEAFLEPNSLPEHADARLTLEAQIRECFGRVVYSHKTHEKCADILLSQWSSIKVWKIILSALTTGGFIAGVFGGGQASALCGVVLSTALLAINAYTKDFDHGELAQKHKQTASDLWLIREKYLSLLTDLVIGRKAIEALQSERNTLLKDLHAVYSAAPPTTSKAYAEAQRALKTKEDLTFAADEIDAFLPAELKKSRHSKQV